MAGQRLTDKSALNNHTGSGDLYMVVDVSDTTGSSAGTSKKLDSKFLIQTDKISVSTAEFQAMDATGGAGTFKDLVSAQGSGFAIVPLSCTIVNTHSSTESSVINLLIGYDTSQVTYYWNKEDRYMRNIGTNVTYYLVASNNPAGTTIDNVPLRMYASANFVGSFSADVYITYHVIKLG